jgi:hypothetical protein
MLLIIDLPDPVHHVTVDELIARRWCRRYGSREQFNIESPPHMAVSFDFVTRSAIDENTTKVIFITFVPAEASLLMIISS